MSRFGFVACVLVLSACLLVTFVIRANRRARDASAGWTTRSAVVFVAPAVPGKTPDDRTRVTVEINVTVARGDWPYDAQYERVVSHRDVRRLISDTRACGVIADSIVEAMTATIKGESERSSPPCAGIDLADPNTFKIRL